MVSADVLVTAERLQVVRDVQVVAMALLVADCVTLLTEEIELIWKSKWTVTKILYLLSRYSPFIDTPLNLVYYLTPGITPHACTVTYTVATWSTAWGMALSELVLLVRTYAIYSRSRKVLIFLGVLWLLWVGANIPIIHIFTKSLRYGDPPTPGLPGCYATAESPIVFASFATLTLFEILIVIMTVRKGYLHFQQGTSRSQLAYVLYRDGVLFFIALLACSLGNVILLVSAPPQYLDLLDTLTRVIHSLICCRILLNIRNAGRGDTVPTLSDGGTTIAFRRPSTTVDYSTADSSTLANSDRGAARDEESQAIELSQLSSPSSTLIR
ncbi:hypothetical protein K474DRAFT_916439 [Panus rudis PR-1116 ss-1]|nr:hypothetical protein K474DRAFT_916439 [Panus rudis PR-1116 ss-1]